MEMCFFAATFKTSTTNGPKDEANLCQFLADLFSFQILQGIHAHFMGSCKLKFHRILGDIFLGEKVPYSSGVEDCHEAI